MNLWGITFSEQQITNLLLHYGENIVMAIAILLVGWFAARLMYNIVRKIMIRAKLEPLLINFVSKILYGLALVFVVIAALNKLGVQTASLIAVLGAAGLAIGLALQGSLSNFAAGIMLVVFKHFRIGDVITVNNMTGVVEDMNIFTTTLHTFTNEKLVIPNSILTGNILTNISAREQRRVDLMIGVSYEDDYDRVMGALQEVVAADGRILKTPAPQVQLENLADSSVVFAVRVWTRNSDWGNVKSDLQREIKRIFDREGISIPYPRRDMNITLSEKEVHDVVTSLAAPKPSVKKKASAPRKKKN